MRYCTWEEKQKAAKAYSDGYRNAAGLYAAIKPVIESFDGKVYNCRFEKALQQIPGQKIYTEKRHTKINIYTYTQPGNRCVTLARQDIKEDDKRPRICAADLLDDARETRASLLKRAAGIDAVRENAESIKRQINELQKALAGIINKYDYEGLDIYDLRYYLRTY